MWQLKTSRALAVMFAVVLAIAEAVLNMARPQWQYAPLWIIDYVIVVALLVAFWMTRKPRHTGVLMAAWALGVGVFYMALFITLDPEMPWAGTVDPVFVALIGAGLGVQVLGFALAAGAYRRISPEV